jgi:hypothetical protein
MIMVMATENQKGSEPVPIAPTLLDWAEYWYPVSWKGVLAGGIITAVGACATIAFLLLQWRTTSIREEQSEWRTASLETQTVQANAALGTAQAAIAKANAQIAEANERTAKLEGETAAARERAAALENEAAQARAEQERLKGQLAWRVLSPEIVAKLEKSLAEHPASINIQHVANDTEALYLAIQIANIFAKANWQVGMMSATMAGTVVFGIWIPEPSTAGVEAVRKAFRDATIGFATDALPSAGMGFGNSIPDAPILFVGSKPIPQ